MRLRETLTVVFGAPIDSRKVGLSDRLLPALRRSDERRRKNRPVFRARDPLSLSICQELLNLRSEIVDARVAGRHKMTVAFDP